MNKILTDALKHFGVDLPPPPTKEQLDAEFHLIILNGDCEVSRLTGFSLKQLLNREHLDEWRKLMITASKKFIHNENGEMSISGEYK